MAPPRAAVAGQHVTVFDYPDGRFKIRFEGRELPYSVFDRLSQIQQADIVNSKRLSSVLTMAREAQLASRVCDLVAIGFLVVACNPAQPPAPAGQITIRYDGLRSDGLLVSDVFFILENRSTRAISFRGTALIKTHREKLGQLQEALDDCTTSLKYGRLPDAQQKQQQLLKMLKAATTT